MCELRQWPLVLASMGEHKPFTRGDANEEQTVS